jgi:predicted enzyme related to lactoylglutathione lyase
MASERNPLARHGGISYLEIAAADAQASARFYERLFGWKTEPRSEHDIRFSDPAGLFIGRFVARASASGEPALMLFFYVDSIDAAVAAATAAGGELHTAPYAEGDVRVARVRDPAGNLLGLWQFVSG